MSDDVGTIVERIDELEDWRTDIVGKSGDNGKLGAIRKDIGGLTWLMRGALGGAAGAITAVIFLAISYGDERGYKRAELETLKAEVIQAREERQELRAEVQMLKTQVLLRLLPTIPGDPP